MEELLKEIREKQTELDSLYSTLNITVVTENADRNGINTQRLAKAMSSMKTVCETTKIATVSEVISKKRGADLVMLRRCLSYIFYVDYGITFPRVGRVLNRDHATVIYHVNTMKDAIFLFQKRNIDPSSLVETLNIVREIVGLNKITNV